MEQLIKEHLFIQAVPPVASVRAIPHHTNSRTTITPPPTAAATPEGTTGTCVPPHTLRHWEAQDPGKSLKDYSRMKRARRGFCFDFRSTSRSAMGNQSYLHELAQFGFFPPFNGGGANGGNGSTTPTTPIGGSNNGGFGANGGGMHHLAPSTPIPTPTAVGGGHHFGGGHFGAFGSRG